MAMAKKVAKKRVSKKTPSSKSIGLAGMMVNSKDAIEGVWVNIMGPFDVRVARANNPRYRSVFQRLFTSALQENNADGMEDLPEGMFDQIQTEAMAETILVGWRGIHDEDGKVIPYSKEKSLEILSNPDAYEIRSTIEVASVTRDRFVSADLESALEK